MTRLAFAGKDLSKWNPGLTSELAGKWGEHVIPGQRGKLQEDLGDGALLTTVQLAVTSLSDYRDILQHLTKTRRGTLLHPRRGAKTMVLKRIREEVRYTERGDATLLDLTFEEAALSEPDQLQGGPATHAQTTRAQAAAAQAAAVERQVLLAARLATLANIRLRQKIAAAIELIEAVTAAANAYADGALAAFAEGLYDLAVQNQLRGLPPQVEAAQVAMRATGSPFEVQAAITALELMLHACTQVDRSIRAALPVPIETEVTRSPGQSIYAFVQQHYAGLRAPAEMRGLVRLILRLNRNLRNVALIPMGTLVTRPSA